MDTVSCFVLCKQVGPMLPILALVDLKELVQAGWCMSSNIPFNKFCGFPQWARLRTVYPKLQINKKASELWVQNGGPMFEIIDLYHIPNLLPCCNQTRQLKLHHLQCLQHSYLVGGLQHFLLYIGNINPNWLIFFQRGWNHQADSYSWCFH